jgi:filamentous hemagglutinin family protein
MLSVPSDINSNLLTYSRSGSYALLAWIVLVLGPQPISNAQNVPITPSGLNTTVTLSLTAPSGKVQYDITGGTRPGGGANLFHSFGEFNVPTNNIANFVNDSGLPTSNILSRVTGTGGNNPTLSSIYGTIQTTGFGNANLFLMNPAGFLFGPNATVNVGGMMAFTTADYLKLSDNVRFNAIPDIAGDALLSAAPVAAFGFIGSNPAAITFEGGQLNVTEGTGLALVGGDISLISDSNGTPSGITTPGRSVLMTSAAGPGEVAADTGVPTVEMSLGNIFLGEGTTLSTAGDPSFSNGSGGTVSIRGGQLLSAGAQILTNPSTFSLGSGGAVSISTTGPTTLTDSTIDTQSNVGDGGGGAINLGASNITLQNSSLMTGTHGDFTTPTIVTGSAGAVSFIASDSVTLLGSSIVTDSSLASGNGGAVIMTAPTIALDESFILTTVAGDGLTPTAANSGPVTLNGSTSVSLSKSTILTESFETQGNSGFVTIAAPTVVIGGNDGQPVIVTSTHSFSGDPSAGHGGNIEISGTNVTFTDLATIHSVADSFGSFSHGGNILVRGEDNIVLEKGSVFLTTTVSAGNAGNVELLSPHVTITGESSLFSETFGLGGAGTIRIIGTEDIALESGSRVSTTAVPGSDGPAGIIDINTPRLRIAGGSKIESLTAGSGQGGSVTVQGITRGAAESVLIDGAGSGIFTDSMTVNFFGTFLGTGPGGNIFVNANSVTVQNSGTLSARTTGIGNAGNILVKADSVNVESGGQITSSSSNRLTPLLEGEEIPVPTGNAGSVTINGTASPAQSVLIDNQGSGIFTDTQGTGSGGSISLDANTLAMTNGASINASSTGPGNTGNIQITAGNLFIMTNSSVTTEANQSGGGAIKITTAPSGTVQLTNSQISASVLDGTGGGGSVDIDPQFVILQNSQITANAVSGPGGNIFITTNLLLPDSTSVISASSQFGQQGTITIQSPVSPASGKLNPISQRPLITAAMVNQRCAAIAGGNISSFTVAGRDSLPAEPGGWLSSPLALGISESEEGTIREAVEESTSLVSLRKIAPPGFLRQTFAVGSSDCQS